MYVRPTIDGEAAGFGVSGKLWRDSLVMYDRTSLSLWSQIQGRAVAGDLEGVELEELPSRVTTWAEWKQAHPESLVLVKPPLDDAPFDKYRDNPKRVGLFWSKNKDPRLPAKQLVLGITREGESAAIPLSVMRERLLLNTTALGMPVVVFSPGSQTAALVYSRTVDAQLLHFEAVQQEQGPPMVQDIETGSRWSWESGACVAGSLEGKQMDRIPGTPAYWAIWVRHYPETEIVGVSDP